MCMPITTIHKKQRKEKSMKPSTKSNKKDIRRILDKLYLAATIINIVNTIKRIVTDDYDD